MAKKSSAYSKGYRKTKKDKPFMSKKEIIALVVILAVVVIAFVLINTIPNRGLIKAGKVQTGDIISMGNTNTHGRYKKLGTVNELEGFAMQAGTSSDNPIGGYVYTPVDENSEVLQLRVSGAIADASTMIDTTIANLGGIGMDSITEKIPVKIGESNAYLCAGTMALYDAEKDPNADPEATEEENAAKDPNSFGQYIYCYVDVDGEYSIGVTSIREGDSEAAYLPAEELEAYMNQFAAAINPIKK